MSKIRSILDPPALSRVSRMELVAKQVVEGFVSGRHPSPFHGSSVEYADHRPYTVGDEIRTVDWKLLAKTDKYYIKLYEEETNLRATILLDASKSMDFTGEPGGDKPRPTKATYAAYLATALAYLMLGQNDAVGLALFDSAVRQFLPPRTTPSHFKRMVEAMESDVPRGDTGLGQVLHQMAGRIRRRGMVILISDLIDDVATVADGLAHFRHDRHEVIVFHVMDPAELSFPYEKLTRFKDAEGNGSIVANPRSVRQKYLERMSNYLNQIKGACLERGIGYRFCTTDMPYERMLMEYLGQRSRMKG